MFFIRCSFLWGFLARCLFSVSQGLGTGAVRACREGRETPQAYTFPRRGCDCEPTPPIVVVHLQPVARHYQERMRSLPAKQKWGPLAWRVLQVSLVFTTAAPEIHWLTCRSNTICEVESPANMSILKWQSARSPTSLRVNKVHSVLSTVLPTEEGSNTITAKPGAKGTNERLVIGKGGSGSDLSPCFVFDGVSFERRSVRYRLPGRQQSTHPLNKSWIDCELSVNQYINDNRVQRSYTGKP